MQIANVLVGLGGDRGHTVPKYGVTPAEILVLQAIHGDQSVHEVEPAGDVARTGRDEIVRLRELYTGRNEDNQTFVNVVFPTLTANVPEKLTDIAIPDDYFKAKERLRPDEVTPRARRAARTAAQADEAQSESDSAEPEVLVDEDTGEAPKPKAGRKKAADADILS